MASRDERKARNIYNESLRRAQAGDTSSYVQGEMQRYGISDPSTAPFRGSGAGNLNPAIDAGKNYIGGLWGGAQRGLDALTQGVAMANENESWFRRNAPNTKRHAGVPMNVRESVMTDRGKAFYDKYVKLAGLNPDRKQYYLDQADTARRNLQITKRINYGMGELGLDETPFKGYESYHDGSRFDIDRFSEAMSEYLPGGEEITEDLTDTIISPDEIETEDAYSTFPGGFADDRIVTGPFPPGIAYPGYNADITITDLPPETFEKPTDEIFGDPEIFNKNFELWTPFGDPSDYPEMFGGAANAYELYKQLEEAHGISEDELLQKMIDEKVIKERIDDELPILQEPSQLRLEDKVKRMSLEELEGLIEDQEYWSGDRIDI